MEQAVGLVRFRPAPDLDRLTALMGEDPAEVIPQGKHFLNHARLDELTQARTYNLLCYTSACVLKRSVVEAVFHGHEAGRLAREVPGVEGKRTLFDSLVNLGTAAERIGEYDRAIDAYREALSMPLDWIGRRVHEEAILSYLGRALYYKGSFDDALTTFDQAGAGAQSRQDPVAGEFLHNLRGLCYMKMGDLEMAEYYLSLAASITNDETRYELRPKSQILGSMAVLYMLKSDLTEAERYARATLQIAAEVQEPHGQVEGNMVLAYCARAQRRVHQAMELSAVASRIAFEYGYVPLIQEMTWLMTHLFPQRRGL